MIAITYNPVIEQFSFEVSDLTQGDHDIVARVLLGGRTMPLATFSTGYSLTLPSGDVLQESWPKEASAFIETNEETLLSVRAYLPAGVSQLNVWFSNFGQTWSATQALDVARPPQPHPSWTWDGADWRAPKPRPGVMFRWDEGAFDWVAL